MRIISGKARGIHLQAPTGEAVRPTGDRVKETLFSMLGPLEGQRVLDLFAGTGAFGLEALSRGAAAVLLVERQPRHVRTIGANLAAVLRALREPAAEERLQILTADARTLPARLPERAAGFDLILADPPWHPAPGEYGGHELVQDAEFARWAGPDALLVLEQDAAAPPPPWHPLSAWRLLRLRRIGGTVFYFARQAG
ncbi:MAG: 16S rRNA (guanine(966)-N(2))-methyltransferase RsmD [Lentisphaeria bacterium]|jgi:16S rRNA (guanine966-N2)-methyltransferase